MGENSRRLRVWAGTGLRAGWGKGVGCLVGKEARGLPAYIMKRGGFLWDDSLRYVELAESWRGGTLYYPFS